MESKAIRDLLSSDVVCDPSGLCMFATKSTTAASASHIIIIRVAKICPAGCHDIPCATEMQDIFCWLRGEICTMVDSKQRQLG